MGSSPRRSSDSLGEETGAVVARRHVIAADSLVCSPRADIDFTVELLVYARNHGLSLGKSVVGISVGESPRVETLHADAVTSYLEVRVRADAPDPVTEITLLVAKALAAQGLPGGGRELAYDGVRGNVRLLPEPGFDSTQSICRAILPVLARCRVHRDTLTTAPAAMA